MDKYDLKLKKCYAEMREQEQQMLKKQMYTRVPSNEPEKKSILDQNELQSQSQPEISSQEQISMCQITQTLHSMIKIIRTQQERINDLEILLHKD